MKRLKVLHLASFSGNIGDNANHYGFYKHLHLIKNYEFDINELEIREFYWKKRSFDDSFVKFANSYDLLIIGGGNYFELWVENSPTGTSIAIELKLLEQINTPILFNALGVDPGQGASKKNINKFTNFLDLLIKRDDYISIRNDGAKKVIIDYIGKDYLNKIHHTPDAGFFIEINNSTKYYNDKEYIAINIATDMEKVRFSNLSYDDFLVIFKRFILNFLESYKNYEIVLVPHIFRDISFINDILNILDDEIRRTKISIAPLLHGKESFNEVMSVYKNAKFVLANRFHANACSIGLETPTIGLVNYRQIEGLYSEISSDNFVDIRLDNFDIQLLNKIDNYKQDDILKTIKSQYNKNIENIEKWLESKL